LCGLTRREWVKCREFEREYELGLHPAMRAVERAVCGCDYGSTAWTTREEAKKISGALELRHGTKLLEIGAGTGWPALYLAQETNCDVTLTDLPWRALQTALGRACQDRLSDICRAVVADAACLPFANGSFDVVNHSDVLCCLTNKRAVLEECRRVIRPGGRMAFSVIYISPGLSNDEYARARAAGPEFVETDMDYPTLLADAGWIVVHRQDLTDDFFKSCRQRVSVESQRRDELISVLGPGEFDARQARMTSRLPVLQQGHLRRDLFLVA